MGTKLDLTGQKFGRLTALRASARRSPNGAIYWDCTCDCGKPHQVMASGLRDGSVRSCGCLLADVARHKGLTLHRTHGMNGTAEHNVWSGMRGRCTNPGNPKYPRYGGRGIKVCERWQDFANFFVDMGPRPPGASLDRIDPDGDYEPTNCRWATQLQQQNNRTNNRLVEMADGRTLTASEAAREHGLEPDVVHQRLSRGLRGEALFKPVRTTVKPWKRQAARWALDQLEAR